jgi:adenylate cyclase
MAEIRSEAPMLIAFVDLTRFGAQSQRLTDLALADGIDAYYERVAENIETAGGRVVKFIGDGALVVFDETAVERGVHALLRLKESVDGFMAERGWDCRLTAKAHFGAVVAGPFGRAGSKRFDVIGKAVSVAAMLEATGVTLSVAAFRKLGPELRRHFRKHTPPVTYIRVEDPRRVR